MKDPRLTGPFKYFKVHIADKDGWHIETQYPQTLDGFSVAEGYAIAYWYEDRPGRGKGWMRSQLFLPEKQPRPYGLAEGEVVIRDDFNAPMSEEELKEFYGESV